MDFIRETISMISPEVQPTPFSANAVRLSLKQWLFVSASFIALAIAVPTGWTRIEPLPECPNNRIPFRLGNDYWVFERYARRAVGAGNGWCSATR